VRLAIHVGAAIVVCLVAASRVYLGVHYPTDVAAGLLVGLAWAAFCTAALEAGQRLAARRRRDPQQGEGDTAAESSAAAPPLPAQPAPSSRSNTRSR
jgi:hypothetical protein